MRKQAKRVTEELEMEMTPMIDCVFLLMIFFVLVIDLSQQELEDLILPKAEETEPDENPPENRPILNITQDGTMIYKKNKFYIPEEHGENFKVLHDLLRQWKRDIPDLETETQTIAGTTMTLVNDPVLVRADKWTEWHYIGKFMEQCVFPEAAFWKLELALSEQDKEEKYFKGQAQ